MLNHHPSALLTFLCCRNTTVSNHSLSFITETPLTPNSPFSPITARQPFTTFSHFLTIFIDETTPSSNCFAFSLLLLKHHYQQLFTIFPDAETPLFSTFPFPLPKHSTVQNSHFLTIFIDETIPSSNCFAFSFLLLKHHYQQPFIFPNAKTPLFNTFFLPMLKTSFNTF
jgi:hypothetical protein